MSEPIDSTVATCAPVHTTLSTGVTLHPGRTYRLRIHVPCAVLYPDESGRTHPFLWDRVMRYDGQDTAWTHVQRVSLVFSDDVQLFDVLANNLDAYHAFVSMTHVCASQIDKEGTKRWSVHICEHRHTGERVLEVCEEL